MVSSGSTVMTVPLRITMSASIPAPMTIHA
jgi:hypothetical protein